MSETIPKFDVHPTALRRAQPPFPVASVRQLLFDDFFLSMAHPQHWDQLAYGIKFSIGRVEKHGSPIMEADSPWETGSAWLSVLREEDRYRMWYNSSHADHRGLRVSYAESGDGIHWEKPSLGIIDISGSLENNVVFDGGYGGATPEFGNVFRDSHADPGEEYKMVYSDWIDRELFFERPPHTMGLNGAFRGASSPDGIHWTRFWENFINRYPDSQNVATWDPTLEKYVAYHRATSLFGALDAGSLRVKEQRRGRAVARMESDDFRQWSPSEIILAADLNDGLNTDIYTPSYSRHPDNVNAHYLFPSFYRHYEGTFEVQLCTSRDNRHWARPCRDTFVPLGAAGEFDCFILSVSPGIVQVNNDTWALYYRAGNGPHGGSHPITLDYTIKSRVSRVTFKRDRVLGIEGRREGGHFSTRPVSFEGTKLVVNTEPTGNDPEILVQLLSSDTNDPIEGYTFDKCRPIKTDGLDTPVVWEGKELIEAEVSRESVRLHFKIRSMRVYAFQFLP